MISAVAARRAAQAALAQATQQNVQEDTPTPGSSTTSAQEAGPAPPSQSNSKRRQSANFDDGKVAGKAKSRRLNKETLKQKKKKKPAKPKPRARYFTQAAPEDVFRTQDDVIAVESDSSSSEPDSDVEDNEFLSDDNMDDMPMEEPASDVKTKGKRTAKRAWSPSMPVSSDEDEEEQADVTMDEGVSSLFPHTSARSVPFTPTLGHDGQILSTYQPTIDTNLFTLTPAEVASISSAVNLDLNNDAATTLVLLNSSSTLCLLGTCSFVVLSGSVSVLGATLVPSPTKHDIYAPRSSPLPVLEAIPTKSHPVIQASQLPQRLAHLSFEFDTLLLLQEVDTGIEGLGNICKIFDDVFKPSTWQKREMGCISTPFRIDRLWMVTQQTRDTQSFILSPTWMRALDTITPATNVNEPASSLEAPIFLVKGPKKSGKSTFARTLLNRLLQHYTHVAFLECDLGQSEFMPGGLTSLHVLSSPVLGPPFTHPTIPHTAHFIGSTTPRSSPSLYLDSICSLIETYRLEVSFAPQKPSTDGRNDEVIPLVVNTMGWTKGLGADMNAKIEEIIGASVMFEVDLALAPQGVGQPTPYATSYQDRRAGYVRNGSGLLAAKTHVLEPVVSSAISTSFTPADHRTLALLSYFYAAFPSPSAAHNQLQHVTAKAWRASLPLCAIPPYEVSIAQAIDSVILTGAGSEDVVPSEISAVLNGAIVGMVKCESGSMEIDIESSSTENRGIPYVQAQSPPLPQTSNCLGLALVRAVSPSQGLPSATSSSSFLHILTPIPPSLLAATRTLVKGELELPIWGWLDFRSFEKGKNGEGEVAGYEKSKVPYLQWGRGGEDVIGGEKKRVRRNLMRRGQM